MVRRQQSNTAVKIFAENVMIVGFVLAATVPYDPAGWCIALAPVSDVAAQREAA